MNAPSGLGLSACVVDASVLVKLVLPEVDSDLADELLPLATNGQPRLRAAPAFIYLECANVLWKRVRRDLLSSQQAITHLADLLMVALQVWPIETLCEDALRLALAHDLTAYDAAYLALAELLAIPLVSADERFIHRAGGPNDRLVLLSSLRPQPNGDLHR